jgi:hypothetical protein
MFFAGIRQHHRLHRLLHRHPPPRPSPATHMRLPIPLLLPGVFPHAVHTRRLPLLVSANICGLRNSLLPLFHVLLSQLPLVLCIAAARASPCSRRESSVAQLYVSLRRSDSAASHPQPPHFLLYERCRQHHMISLSTTVLIGETFAVAMVNCVTDASCTSPV